MLCDDFFSFRSLKLLPYVGKNLNVKFINHYSRKLHFNVVAFSNKLSNNSFYNKLLIKYILIVTLNFDQVFNSSSLCQQSQNFH